MRRSKGSSSCSSKSSKPALDNADDADYDGAASYFTYRPLSNLPTPPPMSRQAGLTPCRSPQFHDAGYHLPAVYRGPAIHLVNLIPSAASLATASVRIVQSMLAEANLPLETVALAVCILDSLGPTFARKWRLTCPLRSEPTAPQPSAEVDDEFSPLSPTLNMRYSSKATPASSSSKRHSLPATPSIDQRQREPQLHIDSVSPELIVLAALVIADKFTEDNEQPSQSYCASWGSGRWTVGQLNTTERSIMEALNYRIMPLCEEDCIDDAMADMQLAGEQLCAWDMGEPSPPDSIHGEDDSPFIPGHARSKTMAPVTNRSASVGLGLSWATAM